ncbi:MAG: hypothetical protein HZB24_07005 [Desulfobacterales bacterium]|nr:hypothetical protein [Desulfobacterales bacterium]
MNYRPPVIAYFISFHGFGHASRAAAVMAALGQRLPGVRLEIFTDCPAWIFSDSLGVPFGYHRLQTDIGMVQRSPLEEDPAATVRALDAWLPWDAAQVQRLGQKISPGISSTPLISRLPPACGPMPNTCRASTPRRTCACKPNPCAGRQLAPRACRRLPVPRAPNRARSAGA